MPKSQIITSSIANAAVDTTQLAADAVDNTILDVAGNYTFTGDIAGASSMELIASNTSGGNGAQIEIDLSTNAEYFSQKLIVHGVYHSSGGDLYVYARNSADDAYIGSGYYTSIVHYAAKLSSSKTDGTAGDWNAANWRVGGYGLGDHATNEDSIFEFDFYNTVGTSKQMRHICRRVGNSNDATHVVENSSGILLSTVEVNRVKLVSGSGSTIYYAGYQHYGILKA